MGDLKRVFDPAESDARLPPTLVGRLRRPAVQYRMEREAEPVKQAA